MVEEGIRTVTPNPDPNKPTPESSGIPVKTHVNDQFGKVARTFFDNAIWLGEDTYDLIKEFVDAGRDILNELNSTRADGRLPDATNPKDLREEQLTPKFYEVRDAPRGEVEASRAILPPWLYYQTILLDTMRWSPIFLGVSGDRVPVSRLEMRGWPNEVGHRRRAGLAGFEPATHGPGNRCSIP
jgi:hypothetical protein